MPVLLDKAVRDLQAQVSNNLAAELRTVETDEGLPANTLKTWSKAVRGFNPTTERGGDGKPEIQVYDLAGSVTEQRHDLVSIGCVVDIVWTSPSTDVEVAEDFGRRWMTALYRAIAKKHPATASDASTFIVQGFDRLTETYDSTMRHARSMSVEVRVHSPRP